MKHVFGLRRRGDAGLLMRGSNGRAIRQHLGNSEHNHMYHHHGGNLIKPIEDTIVDGLKDMHLMGKGKNAKTYLPLKFKM